MKKINNLIKKEAANLRKDIDNKSYYAKSLWDATPEEIMERATQSVLREYDLTGLDGNQLTLLGSKRQPMYLAVITGTDERYGVKREFVSNPDRGRNNYTFTLEADTYYAWKESKVEYFGYFDGEQMAIMTKDEMVAAFEEKEEPEVIEEETTIVENKEIEEVKEVTIDFGKIVNLLDELTQKEIADKTGISQQAISKYKRGETALTKMSVENAMKLVELYEQVQNAKLNEEIKGVNEASYESNFLGGWQSKYMQLVYNKADNQVWYEIFTGPVGSSFLQLNDEDDISLGFIAGTVSPGEIISAVKAALSGDYYLWN
ncbi:helix-turn-helix transcriptional regulator [Enterococcus cecorum]|uniref:helix-turn-helix domain-containing protein n=1 Tax=Enterococcus cecorum TaxID=44008 RepID=UPI001FABA4F9|nr:helix-turn-helix transcriptional regulator [Enterococcus cecorum]MCJ0588097.1 helix-turn-helix transcriptional regulator [Enterococcus cecorum]MCJ0591204.1 helix-turn-helix transcriptional regulator [Enterococcus cecorum]